MKKIGLTTLRRGEDAVKACRQNKLKDLRPVFIYVINVRMLCVCIYDCMYVCMHACMYV